MRRDTYQSYCEQVTIARPPIPRRPLSFTPTLPSHPRRSKVYNPVVSKRSSLRPLALYQTHSLWGSIISLGLRCERLLPRCLRHQDPYLLAPSCQINGHSYCLCHSMNHSAFPC
eukprot:1409801-Amphidinium_carterae.1